jgi:transcriptional regulator with XRE-family HTH domain
MAAKRTHESKARQVRIASAFGRHLKAAMEFRGVERQLDLTLRSGISEATISRLLHGRFCPDLEQLAQLAVGLGCDASELVPPRLAELVPPPKSNDPHKR